MLLPNHRQHDRLDLYGGLKKLDVSVFVYKGETIWMSRGDMLTVGHIFYSG